MKNIWDFWAGCYDKLWVQKYSLRPSRGLVLKEIEGQIAKENSGRPIDLLDVGCGTGQLLEDLLNNLQPYSLNLTGLDASERMIEFARRKKLKANFVLGDAQNLPFAAGQFDIITCCHSFPYYHDKPKVLQEFIRVVRPGGCLIFINASINNLYDKIILAFVEMTTGKANYLSARQTASIFKDSPTELLHQKNLKTFFFMPSIILTMVRSTTTLIGAKK